jgi:DNA-binding HxlR family transcriptional regulator
VDYTLTSLGSEVAAHVEALTDWIEENIDRILLARGARPKRATRLSR